MAVRTGMTALVARLRKSIGDTAQPYVFEDEDLQTALDERSTGVSAYALIPDAFLAGDPTVFRAPRGWWEADSVISDGAGGLLTADGASTDPALGVWAFTAAPSGGVAYVTGRAFDFYGTAANLLEEWAARSAREFDFVTDSQRFDRSQKREGLLAVAREYGRRAIIPGRSL